MNPSQRSASSPKNESGASASRRRADLGRLAPLGEVGLCAASVGGAGCRDRPVLVPVIQRDPIMWLPDRFGWFSSVDLSAVIAGAGLAAVAVLIRSLSTLTARRRSSQSGVTATLLLALFAAAGAA